RMKPSQQAKDSLVVGLHRHREPPNARGERQLSEACEHPAGQSLALPRVGDHHRDLGGVRAGPPKIAGDADHFFVNDGAHSLSVVMIDVQKALWPGLLGTRDRAEKATVDGFRREPEEQPPQLLAVRAFEACQSHLTRCRCMDRKHLDYLLSRKRTVAARYLKQVARTVVQSQDRPTGRANILRWLTPQPPPGSIVAVFVASAPGRQSSVTLVDWRQRRALRRSRCSGWRQTLASARAGSSLTSAPRRNSSWRPSRRPAGSSPTRC